MQVVDNDGLKKADLAAKNKKKRYEKRYELETYYKVNLIKSVKGHHSRI